MAVSGYDLGLVEARLAREIRHVLGALPHVAVFCGDGGQGDPVLYPLDRGLATGFRGFTDGRVEIVCCPRAARAENYRARAYQRCRSQELAAVQAVRCARAFSHSLLPHWSWLMINFAVRNAGASHTIASVFAIDICAFLYRGRWPGPLDQDTGF
jgi:hypothetical protein